MLKLYIGLGFKWHSENMIKITFTLKMKLKNDSNIYLNKEKKASMIHHE